MADLHSPSTNNTTNLSYSFGSVRYYCQSCQRPFSQIRADAILTQAHCPRCNQYSDEISTRSNMGSILRSGQFTLLDTRTQPQPESESQSELQPQPQQQTEPQSESQPESQAEPQSELQPELQAESQADSQPESQAQQDPTSQPPGSPVFIIRTIMDPLHSIIVIQRIPLTQIFTHTQQSQNSETEAEGEGEAEHGHEHEHDFGSLLRLFIPLMTPTAFPAEAIFEALLRNDLSQHGTPPASQDAMDNLEKVNYSTVGADVSCCPVCFEEYKDEEALLRLPCKHEYHGECVKTWLGKHNSCPMCRKEI